MQIFRHSLSFFVLPALLLGCGDKGGAAGSGGGAAVPPAADGDEIPAGATGVEKLPSDQFSVWHQDFPVEIRFSPRHPGRWYDRSRRRALERVADNLAGTCTRDAWLLAKEFFTRVPVEDADVLIDCADRAMAAKQNDVLETTLGAMNAVGSQSFSPVIIRALDRATSGVQLAACRALVTCGTREAIEYARERLLRLSGAAQAYYFEALAEVLGDDVAAREIDRALRDVRFAGIQAQLLEDAFAMSAGDAFVAIKAMNDAPPPGREGHVFGVRHAAGDEGGTLAIRQMLESESPKSRMSGLQGLAFGGHEFFKDKILELTMDPSPEVRLQTTMLLEKLEGDNVIGALENLALDDAVIVRQEALRILNARGETGMLDDVLEEFKTATGSAMASLLSDLVHAKEARAIPLLAERIERAPRHEKRFYIQAIAEMSIPEIVPVLAKYFLGEPINFSDHETKLNPALDSRAYLPLLMINARGGEQAVVDLYRSIDRADYVRRALLLGAIQGIGVDRRDEATHELCFGLVREVLFDTEEIPQMRLRALDLLRRGLTIDDVMNIKRLIPKEEPAMQRALNDFLLEFF